MFKNWKIKQFNKRASSPNFKPQEVINSLGIKEGDIIADIGSGGGYYSFEFAKLIGEKGKVFAVDTEQNLLDHIKNEINKHKLTNVETVLIKDNGTALLTNGFDLIFLRNVFHHLPEPFKFFGNIKKYLKLNGRIAIIDYKKYRFNLFRLGKHFVAESEIVDTMTKCGYSISKKFDFLLEQSFIIFKKGS
jgi:ubiquinone/menaquinone biosynthesis C-methylase UbiE